MTAAGRWCVGLLAGLAACADETDTPHRQVVPVGSEPMAVAATADGRTVVSVNYPAAVSVVDVRAGREAARVEAPLRSPEDRLVDVAIDPRAKTAWVASNGGEIFSVDLASHAIRPRCRSKEPLALSAVAWDADRSRVWVGDSRGGIHWLDGSELRELFTFDAWIVDLQVHGPVLFFTATEGPVVGDANSSFGAYDLAAGDWLFDRMFEAHSLGEMSVAGDRLWIAESGRFRLLEFTVQGRQIATRYLDPPDGLVPGFAIDQVAASHAQVVIASAERSAQRILAYRKASGGFRSLPDAQYAVPGSCTALCLVGEWGLAAGVGDDVVLIPREDAQPFAPE